ncbi:MAG TPA: hypothetical protein PK636_07000, partial [bacterium]|nr:hypothetical protein [bacterium]
MKTGLVLFWGAAAMAAAAPAQTVVSSSETAVTAIGPETVLEVAVEGGYLYGYSQYEIKGDDWFWGSWKSRLKWPLDTVMTGGSARLALKDDTFEIGVSFLFNVTDDPGELEDWDWVGGEMISKGVVDTSLTAYLLDCSAYWNMVKKERFTLGLGLGFAWQHFSWDG